MTSLGMIMAIVLCQDSADAFYQFKPGTTWVWDVDQEKGTKTVYKVVTQKEKEVILEVATHRKGDNPEIHRMSWRIEDGFLIWATYTGDKREELMRLLKVGSKKGDTWKSAEYHATHMGVESVTVPAGTFEGAVHVNFKYSLDNSTTTQDFYIVPNVGLVKHECT